MTPVVINFDSIYLLWLIFKTKNNLKLTMSFSFHTCYLYISTTNDLFQKKKKKKNLWPFFDFIECLYENKDHIPVSKIWIWDNTYKVNEIFPPFPWPGLRKNSVTPKAQKIFEIPVPCQYLGFPLPPIFQLMFVFPTIYSWRNILHWNSLWPTCCSMFYFFKKYQKIKNSCHHSFICVM